MKITIDDDLFGFYWAHVTHTGSGRKAEDLIEERLQACAAIPPEDRVVIVHGATLNAIEAMTEPGAIVSQEDLATRVRALCDVTVGEVRIEFTVPQLQSLHRWAFKNGITTEEAIRRTVSNMSRLFFDYVPVAKT